MAQQPCTQARASHQGDSQSEGVGVMPSSVGSISPIYLVRAGQVRLVETLLQGDGTVEAE